MLWAFIPIAVLVTLTPGPATALIVRSAVRGGHAAAMRTMLGNSTGIATWALLSALGVSALVAASEAAFLALKIAGAIVLVWLGIRTLRGTRDAHEPRMLSGRSEFRDGLVTAFANPKLAVFFVALFPQFIPAHAAVLPRALVMAALIVACDLVWFTLLAWLVVRAKHAIAGSRLARRVEQATGAVMLALAGRLALEHR
jgi:threonine/homoserine/homoserine lactone efflux protein